MRNAPSAASTGPASFLNRMRRICCAWSRRRSGRGNPCAKCRGGTHRRSPPRGPSPPAFGQHRESPASRRGTALRREADGPNATPLAPAAIRASATDCRHGRRGTVDGCSATRGLDRWVPAVSPVQAALLSSYRGLAHRNLDPWTSRERRTRKPNGITSQDVPVFGTVSDTLPASARFSNKSSANRRASRSSSFVRYSITRPTCWKVR
jgi:hypothetical protein